LQIRRVDSRPGYLRVADAIEEEIVAGRLSIGDVLPIEANLALQLGVNRSTLREGLRALENAGLVSRAGGKRLEISVPSNQMIAKGMSRAMGMVGITVRELWELQTALEPLAARLAAERVSEDIARRLMNNLAETEGHLSEDAVIIRLDTEFHRLIAEATANRALILSTKPIGMLLIPATRELYRHAPQARHRLLAAHRNIADAVIHGDQDNAQTWMAKHIRDFKRGYEVAKLDPDQAVSFNGSL
jgi:DNA-binding FadR family transcriptional regulator